MVQRKAPEKLNSQVESKKNHAKSERHSSSHQHQDIRNKGGSDLKKMMKRARSIKAAELERLTSPQAGQYIQFNKSSSQKKPSPVKRSSGSPNYMKPTSSSDARKDQLQVSILSPTAADKNQSPKNRRNSNHLKPSSAASGVKPAKALTRKSSLGPVRPSMKKSSGIPLHPNIDVNRATCSSIMKESNFPNFLELNPGGTELEGTSVLKVCPYTYCSLNGHRHAPLPPLKCFMSARRRLLKTQRSMKLKGLSSFRKRRSEKDEKGIDTGQMVLHRDPSVSEICPLIEEVGRDFFVEIYVKTQEEIPVPDNNKQGRCDMAHPEVINEISLIRDGEMSSETRIEEDGEKDIRSMIDESGSVSSSDDNVAQGSDFSVSEMDVLEYIEHDHEMYQDMDYPTFLAQDCVESSYESCDPDYSGVCGKGSVVNENRSVFEATDMDLEDSTTPYLNDEIDNSAFPQDDTSNGLSLKMGGNGTPGEEASTDVNTRLLDEGCEEYSEDTNVDPFADCASENENDKPTDEDDQSEIKYMVEESSITISPTQDELEMSDEYDQEDALEIEGKDTSSNTEEDVDSLLLLAPNDTSEDSTEASTVKEDNEEEIDGVFDDQASGSIDLEKEDIVTRKEGPDHAYLGDNIDGKNWNYEDEDANKLPEGKVSNSHWGPTPREQDMNDEVDRRIELESLPLPADVIEDTSLPSEKNCSADDKSNEKQEKPEKKEHKEISITETGKLRSINEDNLKKNDIMLDDHLINFEEDAAHLTVTLKFPEEEKATTIAATNSNQLHPDNNKLKRANITRKKIDEELEELKAFNPRAPNFLPIELDPEAEKVDLRHQMMDERKNSEEWMIDYALRQAVTKLGPARKRKVALLVEAFETVQQVPTYKAPLQHATVAFAHARPMQACS